MRARKPHRWEAWLARRLDWLGEQRRVRTLERTIHQWWRIAHGKHPLTKAERAARRETKRMMKSYIGTARYTSEMGEGILGAHIVQSTLPKASGIKISIPKFEVPKPTAPGASIPYGKLAARDLSHHGPQHLDDLVTGPAPAPTTAPPRASRRKGIPQTPATTPEKGTPA